MPLRDAITSGFRGSFNSRDPLARGAYRHLVPVVLILSVAFASQVAWLQIASWRGMAILAFLFCLNWPLLHVVAFRLNDAGVAGSEVFLSRAASERLRWRFGCALGVSGFVAAAGGLAILLCVPAFSFPVPPYIVFIIVSLIATSTILGQALVASEHGTNRHGPNPHEVPQ